MCGSFELVGRESTTALMAPPATDASRKDVGLAGGWKGQEEGVLVGQYSVLLPGDLLWTAMRTDANFYIQEDVIPSIRSTILYRHIKLYSQKCSIPMRLLPSEFPNIHFIDAFCNIHFKPKLYLHLSSKTLIMLIAVQIFFLLLLNNIITDYTIYNWLHHSHQRLLTIIWAWQKKNLQHNGPMRPKCSDGEIYLPPFQSRIKVLNFCVYE